MKKGMKCFFCNGKVTLISLDEDGTEHLFECQNCHTKIIARDTFYLVAEKLTSDNNDYAKLPIIEECYQAIPFPSDERECAMFVAGIAECHKFVSRYFA